MLPVAGSFVKGLAGAAVVFLENLERLEKNKEDAQVLARDITEVVVIVRDVGINAFAESESAEYAAEFKNACSEFQKFLSDLTTKVIDIERADHGLWRNIKKTLNFEGHSRQDQDLPTSHGRREGQPFAFFKPEIQRIDFPHYSWSYSSSIVPNRLDDHHV
ncbi:hypothetical protein EDD85DRAFT_243389 [Armillaria nabsnona]|nr:hypothetical protein EDD85DRAFT_243389 [Armillaria nabsnona]